MFSRDGYNIAMDILATLKQCENQMDAALWSLEVPGQNDKALEVYQEVETRLEALELGDIHPAYTEQQRILSYCLMRQGNLLRQMGQPEQALALSLREIAAARASGDSIALARSLMSNGANFIVTGDPKKGLSLLEESRLLFEKGDSYDHRQGLGWYWILQADLINAGLVTKSTSESIKAAGQALTILRPLENWPGVARAFSARAQALENLGKTAEAEGDRQEQKRYEAMVEKRDGVD